MSLNIRYWWYPWGYQGHVSSWAWEPPGPPLQIGQASHADTKTHDSKTTGKTKKTKKSKGFHQSLSISPRKTQKTKKTKVFSNHGGQTKCGGAVGEVLKVCENCVFFCLFGFTRGFVRFCLRTFDFFGLFGFPNDAGSMELSQSTKKPINQDPPIFFYTFSSVYV